MRTVGAQEVKAHLAQILDEVEDGEEVTITRRGRPVAKLVPVAPPAAMTPNEVMDALREFRKGNRLAGVTIRELIEEGRRY